MPVNYNQELRLAYLRAAQASVEEEESKIQLYRDYYDGEQDIELTDRQEEYLREEVTTLGNICKRVVAVPGDRLNIAEDGIEPTNDAGKLYADIATTWWSDISESDDSDDEDASATQTDIYEASLRDGNVAIIVGWDQERERPTFTSNSLYDGASGLIRFHYDADNKLMFASKRWTVWDLLNPGETGKRRLTIYTSGAIERFEADIAKGGTWRSMESSELNGLPNPQPWTDTGDFNGMPLGIPVIPFENPTGSELVDIINIQELLNHNLTIFDISVDMHAWPIPWFAGANFPIDASTGKATIPTFGPGQAINLPSAESKMGRIEAADLKKLFDSGILSWIQVIALVKGWPMFVFQQGGTPPSGIALTIMEQSLVNQIRRKQTKFSGSWRKAFNMGRKLHKLMTREELAGQIKFRWDSPETVDPQAEIEALARKFETGNIPLIQRWRELGYSEQDIEQMLADRDRLEPDRVTNTQLAQLALAREQDMVETVE